MGRMMKCFALALVALCVANVMAMPIEGDFDAGFNPAMVDAPDEMNEQAQIEKAISAAELGMDASDTKSLGESSAVSDDGDIDWAKKTTAEIQHMSTSELAMVPKEDDDKLIDQFKADVQNAKNAVETPQKRLATKTEVTAEATAAEHNTQLEAELRKKGEEAELDMQESIQLPSAMSLLQEAPENDADMDLGESDEENFALMDGSDDDVAKQINEQISSQVQAQLGETDTDAVTGDVDLMKRFEADKASASQFVETEATEKAKQDKAKNAIKKALEEAQMHMQASMERMGDEARK